MASVQGEAAQFKTRLDLGTREEGLETCREAGSLNWIELQQFWEPDPEQVPIANDSVLQQRLHEEVPAQVLRDPATPRQETPARERSEEQRHPRPLFLDTYKQDSD